MASITINLPDDYTLEQAYEDAALASGWTPAIEMNTVDTSVEPPKIVLATVPNIPARDFGQEIWVKVINDKINATRVEALRIRLATAQGATIAG